MGDDDRPGGPPRIRATSVFFHQSERVEGGADGIGRDSNELHRRHDSAQDMVGRDDAADETTGIVSRGSGQNYRATQAVGPKHSIYRRQTAARGATGTDGQGEDAAGNNHDCQDDQQNGDEGTAQDQSWLRRKLGAWQSIDLENKGSVARDHLALERTFLAWLRTSLAFASIGVAITQLFRLNTTISDGSGSSGNHTFRRLGKPLGSAFLAISILTLLLGARRYFHGQEWIIKGKFPASRGTIVLMALVALAIMIVSLVVVIVIRPAADEDDLG